MHFCDLIQNKKEIMEIQNGIEKSHNFSLKMMLLHSKISVKLCERVQTNFMQNSRQYEETNQKKKTDHVNYLFFCCSLID